MDTKKEVYPFLRVQGVYVQKILSFLQKDGKNIFNITQHPNIKITESENEKEILIPLLLLDLKEIDELNNQNQVINNFLEVLRSKFSQNIYLEYRSITPDIVKTEQIKDVHTILRTHFPEELVSLVPVSFDVIGDILITDIDRWDEAESIMKTMPAFKDFTIQDFKKKVGEIFLSINNSVKTVLNKKGKVDGEYRIREFEILAGDGRTETEHHENGCVFQVDISKMFFSPRLVYERKRISELLFSPGDIVLDTFAGIGPFSIQIASKYDVEVISCEKNPHAFDYLQQNIKLNKKRLKGKIIPYEGDFRELKNNEIGSRYKNRVNFIIMNLPERNLEFIRDIVSFISQKGTYLVIYLFGSIKDPISEAFDALNKELTINQLKIKKCINSRIVKGYSSTLQMVVLENLIDRDE